MADYARTGVSLAPHSLQQIRPKLRAARWVDSRTLRGIPDGQWVWPAGMVNLRQRPQTASGVTFATMEDEHGLVNVIGWKRTVDAKRQELLKSRLLGVEG